MCAMRASTTQKKEGGGIFPLPSQSTFIAFFPFLQISFSQGSGVTVKLFSFAPSDATHMGRSIAAKGGEVSHQSASPEVGDFANCSSPYVLNIRNIRPLKTKNLFQRLGKKSIYNIGESKIETKQGSLSPSACIWIGRTHIYTFLFPSS